MTSIIEHIIREKARIEAAQFGNDTTMDTHTTTLDAGEQALASHISRLEERIRKLEGDIFRLDNRGDAA